MLPSESVICCYASDAGTCGYSILHGGVKSSSLKDICLCICPCPYLVFILCAQIISLYKFGASILILISFPLCHYIPLFIEFCDSGNAWGGQIWQSYRRERTYHMEKEENYHVNVKLEGIFWQRLQRYEFIYFSRIFLCV